MRVSVLSVAFALLGVACIYVGVDFMATLQPSLPVIPAGLFALAMGCGFGARHYA